MKQDVLFHQGLNVSKGIASSVARSVAIVEEGGNSPSIPSYRITEDGDARITEDSNYRITER